MKMPIRIKLLLYMSACVLLFTIVLLSFNMGFTKNIYISHKKDILIKSAEEIRDIAKNHGDLASDSAVFALQRLERIIGGSISIGTLDGKIYYPTEDGPGRPPRINPFLADKTRKPPDKIESYDQDSFFITTEDPYLKFETLRFQTTLDNGLRMLIWLPMSEISENISLFNQIIAVTAAVILIASVLWSLFVSSKFTKPIRQMNQIAKKISLQDFSETIEISGNDELTELAGSINEISHKLSNSINWLSEKNHQLEIEIINEKNLDKMRKEFVAGVSHELKTPIFLIQGYAEGLKTVAHNEEKRNFYCDVIMNETEKMDKLLKDLLSLSQMESGMFRIQPQAFDIVALARHSLQKFRPVFDREKINVELCFPYDLLVFADPVRAEQVMINFINNAIDYLDNRRNIRVSISAEGDKAKIAVFNSGKHIGSDEIDKIWTPFYKDDLARKREHGGTGLGLSIVKAIQNSQKNEYGVANLPDGVEFWIMLDRREKT